jgi:arylsulfatase A-like enzyme
MSRVIAISVDGIAGFYWADPSARMPNLRRLADRGAVCSRMEAVFPSTTWPTHASRVTGTSPRGHGVAGNHVLNRHTRCSEDLTGDPVHDAPALLTAPTIYDLAHAAGRRTAAIDWPATRNAASLDWSLPFFKDQRVFESQTPRRVWAELGALGYPLDRHVPEGTSPAAVARDLVPELSRLEGVARVWTPAAYAQLGLPTPEEKPARRGPRPRGSAGIQLRR